MIISVIILLAVEITQYILTISAFNISDIICGLLGSVIGYIIFRSAHRKKLITAKKFSN
ncbi:MAG TPA: hypothetical protein IAB53_05085 [Candidatus Scybalocola faecipullorum]|nr:hypothetical protein [Candidatus Scybalocola faecipullorum]